MAGAAPNPFETPKVEQTYVPSPGTEDERIRKEHLKHEASIQGIGSLWILGGAVGALVAASVLLGIISNGGSSAFELGFVAIYGAVGGVSLWTGIKVRGLRREGRVPGLVLGAIGLLGIPVGTLISIYILYMLGSKKGEFVMSDEYRGIIERTPDIKYRTSIVVWIVLGLFVLLALGGMIAAATA